MLCVASCQCKVAEGEGESEGRLSSANCTTVWTGSVDILCWKKQTTIDNPNPNPNPINQVDRTIRDQGGVQADCTDDNHRLPRVL